MKLTHIGGPTLLIEVAGRRLLTDPTFDDAGKTYKFGWGTSSVKLAGPALSAGDVLPIDAVLLSHEHHDDNLDTAGRALLRHVPTVVTTVPGARALSAQGHPDARALAAGDTTTLSSPGKPDITITATPCRHGPPLSHPIVGEVIGFALAHEQQTDGVLWISGDTVLHPALRDAIRGLRVDLAVLHLGGVQFPVTGPARYTMTAHQAVALAELMRPRTIVPIHYEGWKHFREGRAAIEAELASAPQDIRDRVRWLDIGTPTTIAADPDPDPEPERAGA
jgi:L-ascorbate metabolism protein UlaG (beta-lactamase superfamily)